MNTHETGKKITSVYFVCKSIITLRQSSLQQGKLHTSSMMKAQAQQTNSFVGARVHTKERRRNIV